MNEKNQNDEIIIYNSHVHCFTIDHVPDYFIKGTPIVGRIPISWFRKHKILYWLVQFLPRIFKSDKDLLERLSHFLRFMVEPNQKKVIKDLMQYYPKSTKYVLLTMDMSFMDAGKPKKEIYDQLEELAEIKKEEEFKDKVYPFIFVDPRRIENDENYLNTLKSYINDSIYQGIKIYPPLGYFPFDQRMKPVYDYALQNNIPIMTHCTKGVVHNRGEKQYEYHPVKSDIYLDGKKAKEFTIHYTNPINFECLLNPSILSKYWNVPLEEVEAYKNLKVCFGHFGGSDEWLSFLNDPWVFDKDFDDTKHPSLDPQNWSFSLDEKDNRFTWFSVICELIKKYDNVWADVSYMLNVEECFLILKVLLESNERIRSKVIFGTDYYVVSKAGSERSLGFKLRGYIGEELFKQIAEINPKAYLSNKINSI